MPDSTRSDNKRSIDKLFDACFNHQNLALLDELVSPDYVGPQGEKGPAAFRGVVGGLHAAFPDIHYTIDEVVGEEDRVAIRWHWAGTHRGAFRGIPATGKVVSTTGAAIFRLREGKIVSAALETDRLGFLQQIGAIPEGAVPSPPSSKGGARPPSPSPGGTPP